VAGRKRQIAPFFALCGIGMVYAEGCSNLGSTMDQKHGRQTEHADTFVLIVDDESSIRDLLGKFLSTKGFDCLVAASVDEAISLLRTRKIGLVLLDWGLRGEMDSDGELVLRFSKANFPALPVIVISGQDFDAVTLGAVEEADGFMPKPFDLTAIADHVFQWLNHGTARVGG
jgi:DNA-binding NtrC family response regulator